MYINRLDEIRNNDWVKTSKTQQQVAVDSKCFCVDGGCYADDLIDGMDVCQLPPTHPLHTCSAHMGQ